MSRAKLEMIFENFIRYCLKTTKNEYNKLNLLLFAGNKILSTLGGRSLPYPWR